ncbi:putative S-adenosylmethionine-dependent methyltransferase MSMEG_2350/MSMEI_2290 [Pedobacter sp. Bi27]|uniref:class I SAM-dependent methyltransferase n=1 Tax=Pedobacter sp. Bi27 TaxID=2822351 RepID=UPI001DD5586A|nr:methyltransferase domain-containing protein [Pedobacter sp. Bi27]CAH0166662.1 putative S-adenosylmethionine-dependent methyltransferase MSMEG_2350/MSMEI_2290 [Pedobacter sp. Bi27]
MAYLNLGCGNHFSTDEIWTNLDFISTDKHVIQHNLLKGIPMPDESFEVVYHSHVLEHFTRPDGFKFLAECYRVLAPNGIIRIAVPDLEQIARNYLKFLDSGLQDEQNEQTRANYEWMLLEMYDQTVRNYGGGNMANYLFQDKIINEAFVFQRIGEEGKALRNYVVNSVTTPSPKKRRSLIDLGKAVVRRLNPFKMKAQDQTALQIGRFRLGGEIHQWMYDRYSLGHLLKTLGFSNVTVTNAFTSNIPNWVGFELDGKDGEVRKPDSLFIEAIKKP